MAELPSAPLPALQALAFQPHRRIIPITHAHPRQLKCVLFSWVHKPWQTNPSPTRRKEDGDIVGEKNQWTTYPGNKEAGSNGGNSQRVLSRPFPSPRCSKDNSHGDMGVELCGGFEQWAVSEQGTLNPPTDAASLEHRIPDGSGWNALQWLICSSLPAQPGSSQSTSHRSVTRLFWNIFSEGHSTPSLGSRFQCLVTAQESCSSLSSDGTYWASVPAHYLLSYCWAQ